MFNLVKYNNEITQTKERIRNMSFDEACAVLCGYNRDEELFDFDLGDMIGTVHNENGRAIIKDNTQFEIWGTIAQDEFPVILAVLTPAEIQELTKRIQ